MIYLVLGTPGNRLCLWPSTSKQSSGVGHTTLNASFMSLALDKVGHTTLNASLASWDGQNKSIVLPADEEQDHRIIIMMSAEGV
jgi:hypothetical protein